MDPVLASSCALSAVTRASTLDFQASKMRAYDGPWQDMQETALARWVCGPSGPEEATSALNAGLWQPWQVTPAANIGLGLRGTPRPPRPEYRSCCGEWPLPWRARQPPAASWVADAARLGNRPCSIVRWQCWQSTLCCVTCWSCRNRVRSEEHTSELQSPYV